MTMARGVFAAFGFVAVAAFGVGCGGGKISGSNDGGVDMTSANDVPDNLDLGGTDVPVGDVALEVINVVPLEHVTSVFPAKGATSVCTDAPLRIIFDTPPLLGAAGMIKVWGSDDSTKPADSFDLAAPVTVQNIGPRQYMFKPVIISGNEAYIYLRKVLKPGVTYHVNIDPGVFTMGNGGPPIGAVADATSWTFTVRSAAPAAGASSVAVTADGTGDFCTVQGAVDYVPAGNTTPVTINVARGNYREIVAVMMKNNITIHGEDRNESVIVYPNSAALQTAPGGTSLGTKFRAMVGIDMSNDITIENITLWNPSPQLSTNGQSEALRVEQGTRIILRNANFKGLQDTFLLTGQVYVANSYVEGDTDFIWGGGVVYFDHCEIKVVGKKGYNVQARNATGTLGYVFVGCNLTAQDGITGHYLARTDKNTTAPASQVAYIDCTMGPHIIPAGWLIDGYQRPTPVDGGFPDAGVPWNLTALRFQEYKSLDPTGAPLDVSQRIPEALQLSDSEAAQLRDVTYVFNGWNPKAAATDAGTD